MFALSTANENERCSGRPVDTESVSEKLSSGTVAAAGYSARARTRTGVGTVPELICTTTVPSGLLRFT